MTETVTYRCSRPDAVDAEVALKAGFITDVGEVNQAPGTKKRPDYFLVGRRIRGRRTDFKVVVLECKGSHQTPKFSIEQLARATVQVETVRVGGRTPQSYMVASHLAQRRITSYLLDPEGEGELWGGATRDMDDFLAEEPQEHAWYARPAAPAVEITANSADSASDEQPPREAPPQSDLRCTTSLNSGVHGSHKSSPAPRQPPRCCSPGTASRPAVTQPHASAATNRRRTRLSSRTPTHRGHTTPHEPCVCPA